MSEVLVVMVANGDADGSFAPGQRPLSRLSSHHLPAVT
jgi:hypothetical protein